MRNRFFLVASFLIFIGVSCNSDLKKNEEKKKLQKLLNVSISDNIEFKNDIVTGSIKGDFTETFTIYFEEEEFLKIFNEVNPSKIPHVADGIYSYSISNNREITTAIFDYNEHSIKYTGSK